MLYLEWNTPMMTSAEGMCCGSSLCRFDVHDQVTVLYYDDPDFDKVSNQTRCCNGLQTWLCGGKGELVAIESTCMCNMCLRTVIPMVFVPICCPQICCPCTLSHHIWVKDAEQAVYMIKQAKQDALQRLGGGSS